MEKQEEIDILHPTSSMFWKESSKLPEGIDDIRCVCLKDKLYVGGRHFTSGDHAKLYVASVGLESWEVLTTPTYWFALTTYQSQLVVAGGVVVATQEITNQLWTSSSGEDWQTSIPAMPTRRISASAIATENPDCLIVAGGDRCDYLPIGIVEVFLENQWSLVQPLPKKFYDIKFALHKNKVYLLGGFGQDHNTIYWCEVRNLIVNCKQTRGQNALKTPPPLWSRFNIPVQCSSLASFGQQIIAIGTVIGIDCTRAIGHFSKERCWVTVGEMPVDLRNTTCVALSEKELVVIGVDQESQEIDQRKVFVATLGVHTYHPDSLFNMSALSKLEGVANIKTLSSLAEVQSKLITAAGLTLESKAELKIANIEDPCLHVEIILNQWASGRSLRPPTWRSLLEVLCEVGLNKLGQEMEDFMNGKLKYLDAYQQALATQECVDMWFVKVVLLGAPRLGKTTACRRLSGMITDIKTSGEGEQPSTGVVESGNSIIIRSLAKNTSTALPPPPSEWCISKNLTDEACMLLQFFYGQNVAAKFSFARQSVTATPRITITSPSLKAGATGGSTSSKGSIASRASTTLSGWKAVRFKNPWRLSWSSRKESQESSTSVPESGTCSQSTDCEHEHQDLQLGSSGSAPNSLSPNSLSPSSLSPSSLSRGSVSIRDEEIYYDAVEFDIEKYPTAQEENENESCAADEFENTGEVASLFRKAIDSNHWKDVKHLLKDMTLLKMEDTGGQPEFMDMLPALTIGPALYLLFCKLTDDLQSNYGVSYLSQSGMSTVPMESTDTVEETLLMTLASVSCFTSHSRSPEDHNSEKYVSNSVAYIIGTHKDLVSEDEINDFDKKLRGIICSTDFFRDGLVQYSSDQRMVLPIDNMQGGKDEIAHLRTFLEGGLKKHFGKLSVPANWLILSLCLRKREKRTADIESVTKLAGELRITESDTKLALWFLHHRAGVLMYYPDVIGLSNTVICNVQVVYDSVTSLIVNTFKLGSVVSEDASERFRKTAQFSLKDIEEGTVKISGDYVPLPTLVTLLAHLNIIARVISNHHESAYLTNEQIYFMPCVLQCKSRQELYARWDRYTNKLTLTPLFIRYNCGFSPLGVFPAMITNIVGQNKLKLVVDGIWKNFVQFKSLEDDDLITFMCLPTHYSVHITRLHNAITPTHILCGRIRELVQDTLNTVTYQTGYGSSARYKLLFECPSHPSRGGEHLCTVEANDVDQRYTMHCRHDARHPIQIEMKDSHLVWFGKPFYCVRSDIKECSGYRSCEFLSYPFRSRPLPLYLLVILGAMCIAAMLFIYY